MPRMRSRAASGILGAAAVAWAFAACGSESTAPDPPPEAFVGTWDGVVFTVSQVPPGTTVVDILASTGASGEFYITVEPSGRYTATIVAFGFPAVEFGQITVDEAAGTLTMLPDGEPPNVSEYEFLGDDYLVLDGPTEFDFNGDMIDEPALAHLEIERR